MLKSLIKSLERLNPRKGRNEEKTFKLISRLLEKNSIGFEVQKFRNAIPKYKVKSDLKIKFIPNCFVSGKIEKTNIISNIQYREDYIFPNINFIPNCFASGKIEKINIVSNIEYREDYIFPNINFNPYCNGISLATFYYVPSIAISKKDLFKIPEEIKVKIKVKKENFISRNILVGNLKNPKNIIFTHYDNLLTAVLIYYILKNRNALKENLFAICGSEELSFEKPYWCKGYREFELQFLEIMKNSKKLIFVDCIGHKKPKIIKEKEMLREAANLKNFEVLYKKVFLLTSAYSLKDKKFLSVYHSNLDTIKNLKMEYLFDAVDILNSLLQ